MVRAEEGGGGGVHCGEASGRRQQDANRRVREVTPIRTPPPARRGGVVAGEGAACLGERERTAGASRGGVRGGRVGVAGAAGEGARGGVTGAAWRFALGSSGTTGRRGVHGNGGSGGRVQSVSSVRSAQAREAAEAAEVSCAAAHTASPHSRRVAVT
eukprot:scaffold85458_cov48-Phaeocystis_antarctica.AAC.1